MTMDRGRCATAARVAALMLLGSPAFAAVPDPWPMFGRDAAHSGRSSSPRLGPGRLKWKKTVGTAVRGGPALLSGGRIVVGGVDGRVAMFDRDGRLLWAIPFGGSIPGVPLSLSSGRIAVATSDGRYLELAATDGALVRQVDLPGDIATSPVPAPDGTTIVATVDGSLVAVGADGIAWSTNLEGGIYGTPAVGPDGTIYVASSDGNLHAVQAGGTIRWSVRLPQPAASSSPAVTPDGLVVIGSRDGRLYAVDAATGALRRAVAVSPSIVSGSPAVAGNGTIHVGTADGFVAAVTSGGSLAWKVGLGAAVTGAVALAADGTVYAAASDGRLTAIAPDGREAWSVSTGHPIAGSPAVDETGNVVVGDDDGALSVFTSDFEWFVPAAARAAGGNGTFWRTDLTIANAGSTTASVDVTFLDRDVDNSAASPVRIDLLAGRALVLADVAGGLFGRASAAGALRLASAAPRLVVSSRTYTDSLSSGTFGQGIAGRPLSAAIVPGETAEIAGLVENASFRTNLGFVNASPAPVTVRVAFVGQDGDSLGIRTWELPPFAAKQLSRVLLGLGYPSVEGVRASVSLVTGGAIFAYASMVDGTSGDPTTLEAVVPGR